MALSANQTISTLMAFNDPEGMKMDFKVAASTTIYKNGFVGLNATGFVVPLTAGAMALVADPFERFVGISIDKVDNSSGSDGDKTCQVLVRGMFQYALSSAAQTDVGMPVFASDDATLTKVSLGNPFIGWIQQYVSSGVVIVRFGDTMNNSHPLISRMSAAIDCTGLNIVPIIHPSENHNGLVIVHAFAVITEAFTGTEDQGVVTLEDTAGTDSGITFTPSDGGADAINDLIPAVGATSIVGTLGLLMVPIPADKGLQAIVTTVTTDSAAGIIKIGVICMPIA